MTTKTVRKIVNIDEEKCNGCGACIISCTEGALQIIDGKVRLISEKYCDGLGACLGECPQGAITIEDRGAEEFDEKAVAQHLANRDSAPIQHKKPDRRAYGSALLFRAGAYGQAGYSGR
jgi:MinD superfamily P-loop ATPase